MKLSVLFLMISFRILQPTLLFGQHIIVGGEVVNQLKITLAAMKNFRSAEIRADHDHKEHVFKGVLLADILTEAGITLGSLLPKENLIKHILVSAADCYQVIFSVAEVDPEFSVDATLLTYEVDGSPLPKDAGLFRLVVPGDQKHSQWVRDITSIKIIFGNIK